jgi:hypothetical protein
MVTSISAPAPVTGATARAESNDLFKRLDTQNKGYLTPKDLASAIVSISARGAGLSQEAANTEAQKIFSKVDANGDAKLTQTELAQAASQGSSGLESLPPVSGQGARDGRGGGSGGSGGNGGSSADGGDPGSASPSKGEKAAAAAKPAATSGAGPIYAPADANRDGTVTVPEQFAYETQQAPPERQASTPTKASAMARSAVEIYRSVGQLAAA